MLQLDMTAKVEKFQQNIGINESIMTYDLLKITEKQSENEVKLNHNENFFEGETVTSKTQFNAGDIVNVYLLNDQDDKTTKKRKQDYRKYISEGVVIGDKKRNRVGARITVKTRYAKGDESKFNVYDIPTKNSSVMIKIVKKFRKKNGSLMRGRGRGKAEHLIRMNK